MMKPDNPNPLVTVYMPTYNRVDLLQRAVESVLNQDYKNIELIVVDDNSIDGTHEYLFKMADEDPRFKYFINEKNCGACVSRNKAIFAANGKFITGLDDDDYFLPNRINNFIEEWEEKTEEIIALYSNNYTKKKNGKLKKVNKIDSCGYRELICSNWIGNQIFTQTEYLQGVHGFDKNLRAWQDLECWYRLLRKLDGRAKCTNECTYVTDISHGHERITTGKIDSTLNAFEYFCNKYDLDSTSRMILRLQLNPYLGESPSLNSILKSIKYLPSSSNIRKSFLIYTVPKLKNIFKL